MLKILGNLREIGKLYNTEGNLLDAQERIKEPGDTTMVINFKEGGIDRVHFGQKGA